jgi:hypothetical protein
MRPEYYILNGNDVFARVYENENGNKLIFIQPSIKVNIEHRLKFLKPSGETVQDDEVMGILLNMFLNVLPDKS